MQTGIPSFSYIWSRLDSPSLLHKLDVIQNTAIRIALGAFKSSTVTALQAESFLSVLSHRCSMLLVRTYTNLASYPSCHTLHSLLLRPYQTHTPCVERALSVFASLWVTPPSLLFPLEKASPLGPWFPLSSLISLSFHTHTHTQWTKVHCPVQDRILFNTLLHTRYHNSLHI